MSIMDSALFYPGRLDLRQATRRSSGAAASWRTPRAPAERSS